MTIVDPIMPHISQSSYIIAFAVIFVFLTICGWSIFGRLFGAIFGGVVSVCFLVWGIVPYGIPAIGLFIVFIELGSVFIRGTPEEKPAETPQKPPEITGAFDKSQFKKRKE